MSNFLTKLGTLSSANEIFGFLGIEYDEKVLHVNRLHILKRYHDYLRQAGQPEDGLDDAALHAAYKQWLEKAYHDFVVSTPVQEKVFKVFNDQAAAAMGAHGFVGLNQIKRG